MLVIDPEECIECNLCVDDCPVGAIFPEQEVPEKWEEYIELNARLTAIWPAIERQGELLVSAEAYRSIEEKRDELD